MKETILIHIAMISITLVSSTVSKICKAATLDRVEIAVGETVERSFTPGVDVSVSRRGIADVFHLGEGRWAITGLRRGLVIISDEKTRLQLDVMAEKEPSSRPLTTEWICSQAGVICQSGRIEGEIRDFRLYYAAESACERARDCLFAATLSPAAEKEAMDRIHVTFGPESEVKRRGTKFFVIGRCLGSTESMQRKTTALPEALRNAVDTECRGEMYSISAKLLLRDGSSATAFGFGVSSSFESPISRFLQKEKITSLALQDERREDHLSVISEPKIISRAFTEATITSGGELGFDVRANGEVTSEWKPFGTTITARVDPIADEKVSLIYTADLKTPGSARSLRTNRLAGESILSLGVPMQLGEIQIGSQTSGTSASQLFADIPIIGPLFGKRGFTSQDRYLELWVTVTRLQN